MFSFYNPNCPVKSYLFFRTIIIRCDMRQHTQSKYFKMLKYLHYLGLINLPNYHKQKWKNIIHKYCFRTFVYFGIFVGLILSELATFIYSIHNLSEFLQRLFENISLSIFISHMIILNLHISQLTNLLDMMDTKFAVTDKELYLEYEHQCETTRRTAGSIAVFVGIFSFLEREVNMLNNPEKTSYILETVYHQKNSSRPLPYTLWFPSAMDVTGIQYIVFYCLEGIICCNLMICIYNVVNLNSIFSTPMVGQFKMLCKFILISGTKHQNNAGDTIYYTDVAVGDYIVIPPRIPNQR